MRYLTADAVTGIPSLNALPAEEAQAVLDDAATLLGFVTENQWVTDSAARRAFEQRDWDPDRFNRALSVLRATGQMLVFDDQHATTVTPIEAPEDDLPPAADPLAQANDG